jgi:hypothetical protein
VHWLQEAGFSDISYEEVVLPLNPWKQPIHNREVACWYSTAFSKSVKPLYIAPCSWVHGWAKEEIQATMAAIMEEALNVDIDAFHTLHLYKAQKPD